MVGGGRSLTDVRPIDKRCASTGWALTVATSKVNSTALRLEPENIELVVAILSYSAAHADEQETENL